MHFVLAYVSVLALNLFQAYNRIVGPLSRHSTDIKPAGMLGRTDDVK